MLIKFQRISSLKVNYRKQNQSVQTFSKLSALWNKQNRTTNAAEAIKSALGTLLITPGETRWNSYYDAVSKVNTILSSPELATKFDALCEQFEIKRLLVTRKRFISEYVQVFKPVCCGHDVLQGDLNASFGYLIPTLHVMINELDELLLQGDSNGAKLTLCEPLVHALKKGIKTRFGDVMADESAQLAAIVHPKFKLDWVDDPIEKFRLTTILKKRAIALTKRVDGDGGLHPTASSASRTTAPSVSPMEAEGRDFFSKLAAKRLQNQNVHDDDNAVQPQSVKISDEVDRYLADTDTMCDPVRMAAYPTIRQMFIDLNTGLPASAAMERLFSLGGRVFTPLRTCLSSHHFEMMMFLRLSKRF